MMKDAPCVRHSRGGEDNGRALGTIESARLIRRLANTNLREMRDLPTLVEERHRILVEVLAVLQEDARRANRERAVQYDGDVAVEPPFLPQAVKVIDERLRPPHGEHGNDEVAAPIHRIVDDFEQSRFLVVDLMHPVAVRRLDNDEIRS